MLPTVRDLHDKTPHAQPASDTMSDAHGGALPMLQPGRRMPPDEADAIPMVQSPDSSVLQSPLPSSSWDRAVIPPRDVKHTQRVSVSPTSCASPLTPFPPLDEASPFPPQGRGGALYQQAKAAAAVAASHHRHHNHPRHGSPDTAPPPQDCEASNSSNLHGVVPSPPASHSGGSVRRSASRADSTLASIAPMMYSVDYHSAHLLEAAAATHAAATTGTQEGTPDNGEESLCDPTVAASRRVQTAPLHIREDWVTPNVALWWSSAQRFSLRSVASDCLPPPRLPSHEAVEDPMTLLVSSDSYGQGSLATSYGSYGSGVSLTSVVSQGYFPSQRALTSHGSPPPRKPAGRKSVPEQTTPLPMCM